ncbi:hypothetical protein AGMMS50276_10490 [Synergistales bacterium]|nr:hypothetical protein AGMMS50276_10490 [Synergistales bacterium]
MENIENKDLLDKISLLEQENSQLKRENVKVSRQVKRLQDTLDRSRAMADATVGIDMMRDAAHLRRDKFMKLMLEHSPDLLILLDEVGNFAFCTDAFLKKAHIEYFEQIKEKNYKDVFADFADTSKIERIQNLFKEALASGATMSVEEAFDIEKSGCPRTYTMHFTPVFNEEGEPEAFVLFLHDITDMTHAKEDAERAREVAERASAAKSDFLSNMSHEMRTPMNAIIGMTTIAKSSSEIDRKNYCLKKIEDASTHLLGVINDILDMSKIEAGKFDLSPVEFNFEKMLQKVSSVISFRVDEKQQKFVVKIDSGLPRILIGDDQRLSQVVTNLLANAVKFTPENGSINLEAKLLKHESDRAEIEVRVIDSGIGISQENQSRLFKSFQQAEKGTSRKFGGTGLGLAISKRIVEMMGGHIWVESEPGNGSTFAFTVSLESAEKSEGLKLPGVGWHTVRVLAIDDASDIREFFAAISEQFKIVCDVVPSGEEALSMIDENGPYNIYFIDWKMPGMNGIELSRRIKGRGDQQSIITMISATEWVTIEEEAKGAGVDKFLSKPLFPLSVFDCIKDCLGADDEDEDESEQQDDSAVFKGYSVLLAEDIEINREIVISLLEPTEVKINCAEDGLEALEMFSASPLDYDMIFMDVQMPRMDGYEATKRIRALENPYAQAVPIVAMTANVFREDIEKCLAAGMSDHIGKPLDITDVMQKLRKYLLQKKE